VNSFQCLLVAFVFGYIDGSDGTKFFYIFPGVFFFFGDDEVGAEGGDSIYVYFFGAADDGDSSYFIGRVDAVTGSTYDAPFQPKG
jgi:hypothetical protein